MHLIQPGVSTHLRPYLSVVRAPHPSSGLPGLNSIFTTYKFIEFNKIISLLFCNFSLSKKGHLVILNEWKTHMKYSVWYLTHLFTWVSIDFSCYCCCFPLCHEAILRGHILVERKTCWMVPQQLGPCVGCSSVPAAMCQTFALYQHVVKQFTSSTYLCPTINL